MNVFFNELSVRPAASNTEACEWIETLAEVGQLIHLIVKSLSDSAFTFRRSEDFANLPITSTHSLIEFLQENYDYGDAIFIFLLGIFDSPYITEDDPQRTEFEYTSLMLDDNEYSVTGLAAAYLKGALAISFDSHKRWNTCQLGVIINSLDEAAREVSKSVNIEHASRKQHILDCHLVPLTELFDWKDYKPNFNATNQTQNILSLIEIYSLYLEDRFSAGWETFYEEIPKLKPEERVPKIEQVAEQIANIQRWLPATGSLKSKNSDRTIYIIPNSNLIATVDTQHGEFEIHSNHKGNNHLGAISFDGKNFKASIKNRSINL